MRNRRGGDEAQEVFENRERDGDRKKRRSEKGEGEERFMTGVKQ